MTRPLLALAASAVLVGTAFGQDKPKMTVDDAAPPKMDIGAKAPPIDIAHWLKGEKPITTFENGKVYVLEFWATWCGPCKAGMEHLSEMQEKYADYGVTVIGVSDEPLHKVVSFLFTTWKADGKLQNDRTRYVLTTDPDESVKKDYFRAAGLRGIPSAFIIGKDGHVEWIGHPMEMDRPLDAVVRDTWDRDAFIKLRAVKQAAEAKLREAYQAEDWQTVIGVYDEMLALDPNDVDALVQKFMLGLTKLDQPDMAYAAARKVMKVSGDDPRLLNMIAWTIVDSPEVTARDLDLALEAAMKASKKSSHKDAAILDTLARVYFEKGQIAEAVEWQTKAVHALGDDPTGPMAEGIKAALQKYEKALGR